jgi:hypothetical protein
MGLGQAAGQLISLMVLLTFRVGACDLGQHLTRHLKYLSFDWTDGQPYFNIISLVEFH